MKSPITVLPVTWGGYFKSTEEQKYHALSLRQAQVFTAIIKDRSWSKGKLFDKFKAVSFNTGMRTQLLIFLLFDPGNTAFSSPRSEWIMCLWLKLWTLISQKSWQFLVAPEIFYFFMFLINWFQPNSLNEFVPLYTNQNRIIPPKNAILFGESKQLINNWWPIKVKPIFLRLGKEKLGQLLSTLNKVC